ncbi:putative acyl transferase acyl hydrolase lysophospholipase [Rosellinia necatrix]|uniref:Putative acyl transferase acyl hydrolase lysophospholipase n=1 Tax=Rosellinia necatrix TaxID=77044 RepID=A0A1W2TP44_ROSNE|nr:putative acyl transferase acyl hydrolase lysophospholipase [Rosellinia necatrix]
MAISSDTSITSSCPSDDGMPNGTAVIGRSVGRTQAPVAIVGIGCRLPGHNNSPTELWNFLKQGGIAKNEPPASRFNLAGHHDKHRRPRTMKSPGGMFMEDVDPAVFDAQFFNISRLDAIAMDPQQRQLLEVTYECLENAGIPLETISGKSVGCLVGTNIVDYAAIQNRDPEDRPDSATIGVASSILSNRISHFLNIHGPSMTIDTACSASLVAVDVACRYLDSHQADGMLVAGANIWLSPEHNEETGMMRMTQSASGKCHSFDAKADGYVKAEGINCVYLKRLDDAIRDGDPVRAVLVGTSTNSAGRTPGIASPSPEAQAAAIRSAYRNAGIFNLNDTAFLECHGTGTLAGDPIEVEGAASVFAAAREKELIIGSIKSNIGHSEAAAGLSGLIKAVLSVENGLIVGNPTFINPNPKIDWKASKVRVTRLPIKWPINSASLRGLRRASVNSFGFGGANAHAVVENCRNSKHISSYKKITADFFGSDADEGNSQSSPTLLAFSANDQQSLERSIASLSSHLVNPSVSVSVGDLAYTLSERRSRHYYRAFAITRASNSDNIDLQTPSLTFGKKAASPPRIGFVFTGQGAQWPQMGRDLVENFPQAKAFLCGLDEILQSLPEAPGWTLLDELTQSRTPEHLRQPEFSQPLVTALQLALLDILGEWGVKPACAVGHSSGEIAAAVAAGLLTSAEAIKVAYYRGQAGKLISTPAPLGMLAVGIGSDKIQNYLTPESNAEIACYNSPSSLTISGEISSLEALQKRLQADEHFARLLQVDLAYHSRYMTDIGTVYEKMLRDNCSAPLKPRRDGPVMFSTVTGGQVANPLDASYWRLNMVSPVKFTQAVSKLLDDREGADFLLEIGPSGALSGPIAQVKKTLSGPAADAPYTSVLKRGADSLLPLYNAAGHLFLAGVPVSLARVNRYKDNSVIVDLPNYSWNHSTKYWHESQASKDWRFKRFINHDLLGSKMNGTNWHSPIFKKILKLADLPWLKDHKIGSQIVFPGAGYIAMAIEAVYQTTLMTAWSEEIPSRYRYRLRDVKFSRALVLEEDTETRYTLALSPVRGGQGTVRSWYEFRVCSLTDTVHAEHSTGLICIETDYQDMPTPEDAKRPLELASPARAWYKAMADSGYNYGKTFRKHLMVETTMGKRQSRSTVDLVPPPSTYGQSDYPMHPTVIDACFHTGAPAVWKGDVPAAGVVLVPAVLGSLIIEARQELPDEGIALASAFFLGIGDKENPRNYGTNCSLYNPATGALLFEMKGLTTGAIEAREEQGPGHNIARFNWDADISVLLSAPESKLRSYLERSHPETRLQGLIGLVAHKNPKLKVLELALDPADFSSIWLQDWADPIRAASSGYHLALSEPSMLVRAREAIAPRSQDTKFTLLDLTDPEAIDSPSSFDLVIVRAPYATSPSDDLRNVTIRKASKSVRPGGFIVTTGPGMSLGSIGIIHDVGEDILICQSEMETTEASTQGRSDAIHVSLIDRSTFGDHETAVEEALIGSLRTRGWDIRKFSKAEDEIATSSTVLITDELFKSVMERPDDKTWGILKQLAQKECKVLWVTTGVALDVTDPSKAAIQGLFRTIRAEEKLRFITLDVERPTAASDAISSCLDILSRPKEPEDQPVDSEFVERDGILHIARILPDKTLTTLQSDEVPDRMTEVVDLHENHNIVRLGAERLGNVDSVHWAEIAPEPTPLEDGCVEVEIYAAGLNYKDVVVTMGIVPGDERMLGGEAAGIITKVSPSVTGLEVGQRVVVFSRGCFANRVHATKSRVHKIPDHMSFEEAATLSAVYLTSIYSLFDLASIAPGKRVLIHSAAGGVGIAAIQLARYAGADIFVTVGTPEKRRFLQDTFGIKDDRMFNSRNVDFASQIMAITDGQGVDIVLNSLTGDMLDESFRILSDGGTMIEIGKKDILDRNNLALEPFDRNISFRSVDMSHERAPDHLVSRLMTKLFELINDGHVKPISPIHRFSFDDAPSAIRLLRAGKHIGKIVLSRGVNPNVTLPVRRAPKVLKLRHDACYLIVGGLRGLCGTLAIYLAKSGAKQLAVLSRSGHDDDKSRGIIKQIKALGSHIDLLTGDITHVGEVEAAFRKSSAPIAGIIQGAMVLRDRPFDSMTAQEYNEATAPKIQGTYNLHHVAIKLNLKLEFFTMLSSISGVVGTRGQANYAAANVFMDAFASYRIQQGFPACSIDLGVIEDSGFIANNDGFQEKHFDSRVFFGINDSVLRKIVYLSILQQTEPEPLSKAAASQMITGIATPQPANSILARDARFSALFTHADGNLSATREGNGSGNLEVQTLLLLLRSKSTDHTTRLTATINVMNNCFMRMLRLSEPMDSERPLAVYGIDSLSAVEIRNWVRTKLSAPVTTLDIMNAASLTAFCEKIIVKVGGDVQ